MKDNMSFGYSPFPFLRRVVLLGILLGQAIAFCGKPEDAKEPIPPPGHRRKLIRGLKSPDPIVRKYSILYLLRTEDGFPEEQKRVIPLLEDPDPCVRFEAASEILDLSSDRRYHNPDYKLKAIAALKRIVQETDIDTRRNQMLVYYSAASIANTTGELFGVEKVMAMLENPTTDASYWRPFPGGSFGKKLPRARLRRAFERLFLLSAQQIQKTQNDPESHDTWVWYILRGAESCLAVDFLDLAEKYISLEKYIRDEVIDLAEFTQSRPLSPTMRQDEFLRIRYKDRHARFLELRHKIRRRKAELHKTK